MDQDRVCSGLRIGLRSFQGLILPPARNQGFRAGNDHEVRHGLRRLRSFDFSTVFVDRNQLAANACVKTAALRIHVVFNANGGDAGPFAVVHRAHDVQRVSVTRVAIRDHRNVHGCGNVTLDFELLAGRDEAGVGNAFQGRGNRKSARPHPVKPGLFDQTGAQRVVGAHDLERSRPLEGFS